MEERTQKQTAALGNENWYSSSGRCWKPLQTNKTEMENALKNDKFVIENGVEITAGSALIGKKPGGNGLPAIINEHPEVVLVDELAHTNVKDPKIKREWQDVLEILGNGINSSSAMTIQHIESLNEK
ncbi:hypothetical protein FQA39_LY18894 [Lamprigera yunnana]|nr:hypothetical protein FQA39_LY18894 [Lamprigera yunnana]